MAIINILFMKCKIFINSYFEDLEKTIDFGGYVTHLSV